MSIYKIIVVEDEFKIRRGLMRIIEKLDADYRIIGEAENGFEGIKLARECEPDLIITDIEMPHMDGLTMIQQIQEMGINSKFIILSGYSEFKYAQKAIKLGVIEYLLKPISITDLEQVLSNLLKPKTNEDDDVKMDYNNLVATMVRTINTDFGKRLGLDLFADQFKMSTEHLSRLFAKETGKTFSDYLKEVRLEYAKKLLSTTNLKIYEIACRVGYPDAKYFSKVFKEYTGHSAKHYSFTTKI